MASAGMDPDVFTHFGEEDDIVEYYQRQLKRDQIEELASIFSVSIPETNKEEDIRKLLEEGAIQELHRYNAELHRIGKDTIIEGIRSINEEKLKPLSDGQLDDKYALLVKLRKWEWKDKLEIIKTLRSFKSKRNYKRKRVDGERSYSNLTEDVIDDVEEDVRSILPELNDTRRKKIDLRTIEKIDESDIILRFLVESKSSRYKQFKFRDEDEQDVFVEGATEVESIRYWPLTSEYVYIDYARKEYDVSLSTHEETIISTVVNSLFEDPEWGDDVQFVDPLDFADQSPNEFVQERVEDQKEAIEENTELLENGKKGVCLDASSFA